MSNVTNIILASYGSNFDHHIEEYVNALNKHCFVKNKSGFKPCDMTGSQLTGGSKFMNGCILLGGFNYLNLSEFINNLKSFDWEDFCEKCHRQRPYSVDLFYLRENEESGYTHFPIYRR
jgi:hypothetical protein